MVLVHAGVPVDDDRRARRRRPIAFVSARPPRSRSRPSATPARSRRTSPSDADAAEQPDRARPRTRTRSNRAAYSTRSSSRRIIRPPTTCSTRARAIRLTASIEEAGTHPARDVPVSRRSPPTAVTICRSASGSSSPTARSSATSRRRRTTRRPCRSRASSFSAARRAFADGAATNSARSATRPARSAATACSSTRLEGARDDPRQLRRRVLFFDTGNVWANSWDIRLNDLRYAVGTGLRYQTPVGPLRFDVGYQLNPIPGIARQRQPADAAVAHALQHRSGVLSMRRLTRILLWTAGVMLTLVLLAGVVIETSFFKNWLRGVDRPAGQRPPQRHARDRPLQGQPVHRRRARRRRRVMMDNQPVVAIDAVKATYSIRELVSERHDGRQRHARASGRRRASRGRRLAARASRQERRERGQTGRSDAPIAIRHITITERIVRRRQGQRRQAGGQRARTYRPVNASLSFAYEPVHFTTSRSAACRSSQSNPPLELRQMSRRGHGRRATTINLEQLDRPHRRDGGLGRRRRRELPDDADARADRSA